MKYSILGAEPELGTADWIRRRSKELAERDRMQTTRNATGATPPGAMLDWLRNPFRHRWAAPSVRPRTKRGAGDPIRYVSAKELRAIEDDLPYGRSLEVAAHLNEALPEHGIREPAQVAAFLAQALTESSGFTDFEEDLSYRTPGLLQRRFPNSFPTIDSEIPYRRNAEGLANYVYATRNGNNQPGDGFRFRGRGPIQITGRDNYRIVGHEDDPDALTRDMATGFDASSNWWAARRLPDRTRSWLDRNAFDGVTRTVNGAGMTDADARWEDYLRARAALAWRTPYRPARR